MKSTLKTIVAAILCYLIVMTSVPVTAFAVFAESVAVSGSGTEQSPYLVYTPGEFGYIMTNFGKSAGVCISLENDIELKSYVPTVFAATLNGNYHKIISDNYLVTVNSGVIDKLVFENLNPYTEGSYTGIGALCEVNNGVISNTLVTANIINARKAAGIAYSGTGSIINCAAMGSVTTYDSDGSTAAGIAFSQGKIANCYVAAVISAKGSSRYGVSSAYPISSSQFTDTFFDSNLYTLTEGNGYPTEYMKSADFARLLNNNSQSSSTVWVSDADNKNNGYPVLQNAFNAEIVSSKTNYLIHNTEYIELSFEEGIDVYYTLDGSEPDTSSVKYTEPIAISDDTVITAKGYKNGLSGNATSFLFAKVDGNGSSESPYLIECEADFKAIAELSPYAHYSLTYDIVLTEPVATFGDFYGVFEGNGHTISNLYSVANTYIYGLFKKNYGVIQNLALKSNEKGFYSNGTFAFKNYGVISGCSYQGNLSGNSERTGTGSADCYQNTAPYYYGLGGFTSYNYGYVNNSTFTGNLNVQTGNSVGGFVGVNSGSIDNCLFSGNITVGNTFFMGSYADSNIAAGFAGYNAPAGSIRNSTADTDRIRLSISSYTGGNIYTFCKGFSGVENCLDLYDSLDITYNSLEWGTVNKYQQDLSGQGFAESTHEHCYSLDLTKPTCTEKGGSLFVCSDCEDTYAYSEIPALGHDYRNEIIPPTYEAEGYTIVTCTRCDLNETTNIVPRLVRVSDNCGDNVTYTLDTGTGLLTISGTGAMADYTSSAPWYSYKDLIRKVVIEDGVTAVGKNAFYSCANIEEIDIASTVKSFGRNSFYRTNALAKTNYHGTVDDWAEITFADSANPTLHSKNLFINGSDLTEIVLADGLTEIKSDAFCYLKNVTKVVIPDSVQTIAANAFYNCTGITELTMPCSAVIASDGYSFNNSTQIKKVTLTIGTGTMADYTYNRTPWNNSNSAFTTLVLSDGIINISDMAFYGCRELEQITFPNNSYTVGSRAFEGTKWIKSQADENGLYIVDNKLLDASTASGDIVIPDTVTEIGDYVFYGNGSITSVTIPDSVAIIGDDAFGPYIRKLTIPCSFAGYTEKAFEKCTGLSELVMTKGTGTMYSFTYTDTPWHQSAGTLKKITLEEGITNIVNSAFRDLKQLTDVTIPDTVTSIGTGAFSSDSSLTQMVLPDSLQTVKAGAFNNCTGLKKLTMPCSATIAASTSFGSCTNIEEIVLTEGTGVMPSFASNYTYTPWYISRDKLKNVTFEEGITNVGGFAFYGNTGITALKLPESVTSIGASAFYGCTKLANINIPKNVTGIGISAFSGCTALRSVKLPDKLTVLDSNVFSGCTNLTDIILPAELTTMNTGCLKSCAITEIIIPATVTNIGNNAFSNCGSLSSVYVLNKDCKLYAGTSVFPNGTVIYGYSGSTAEAYAKKYSRSFTEIYGACPECGSYDMSRTVIEPNCTEKGYSKYVCKSCKHEFNSDFVDAKGHSPVVDPAVEASCIQTGLTEGSHCSVCETILSEQQIIPKTSHTIVTDIETKATCTEPGLTEGSHCAVCGKVFTEQKRVDELGHDYAAEITKDASCTQSGTVTYTCSRCDKQYTQTIPKLSHTIVADKEIAATCTKDGKTLGTHCSVCGTILTAQKTVPALGHRYDEGIVSTAPKCIETGVMTYTCKVCHDTKTETIKATGHTIVTDKAVPATCTANGKTAGSHCSICGEIFNEQQIIPFVGHSWDNGSVSKPATCSESGRKTFTCLVCKETKEEIVEPIAHTPVVDPAVPATCTESGKTEGSHCGVCELVLVAQNVIPAKNHSYQTEVTAPTCTEEGYTKHTCIDCGDSFCDNTVDPTGHSYENWESDEENHWHTCTVCRERIDISTHTYEDDRDESCNVCGYVRSVNTTIKSICVEKVMLIENLSGYRDGSNNRFVYTLPEILNMTVTLYDGTVLNMDEESHAVIIDSQPYYIEYEIDTSNWKAGQINTVTAKLCGKEFTFEVEILANPYTKLSIEQTDDFYLVFDKTDGSTERQRVISLDARLGDQGLIGGILKTDKYEFPIVKIHYDSPDNGYSAYEKNVYIELGDMTSNTIQNCYWLKAQCVNRAYISATAMYRWYKKYSDNSIFRGYDQNDYEPDAVITIAANALAKPYALGYDSFGNNTFAYIKAADVLWAVNYMFGITDLDLTKYSLYDAGNPEQIKVLCTDGGFGPSQIDLTTDNGKWNLTFRETEAAYPYDSIHFVLDESFCIQSIEFVNDTDQEAATEISIENKNTLAGKEVTVSVDINNNVGLAYLKLSLEYDVNVLELVSVSNANLLHGNFTGSQSMSEMPYILQWMSADDSNADGTIVRLTFRVRESTENGNYTVLLYADEAYNADFDDVDIFVKPGVITVCDYITGDINGDGIINGKDGILCSQALAGWDIPYSTAAADVNGDGEFNGKDGILLSQYLAGWNVTLGKGERK